MTSSDLFLDFQKIFKLFIWMYILGLNAYHADASAAIFKDGILIAATEEERFRRMKHWAGFPSMAIAFCLKEAGITSSP